MIRLVTTYFTWAFHFAAKTWYMVLCFYPCSRACKCWRGDLMTVPLSFMNWTTFELNKITKSKLYFPPGKGASWCMSCQHDDASAGYSHRMPDGTKVQIFSYWWIYHLKTRTTWMLSVWPYGSSRNREKIYCLVQTEKTTHHVSRKICLLKNTLSTLYYRPHLYTSHYRS